MVKYNVEEFIKEYKSKWICYCEIIILSDGNIVLACPSHTECLLKLTGEKREVIDEKMPIYASPVEWYVDYLSVVSVWYNYQILSKNFTMEQIQTLEKLEECELIKKNRQIV